MVGVDLLAATEDGTSLGYGATTGRQNIHQQPAPQWAGVAALGSFGDA
jgi:hypothetical protein